MTFKTNSEKPMFSTAIILAGGVSSRMGFDKQTLMLDGRPLIENLVTQLNEHFDDIIVVTDRPSLYSEYNVRVTNDIYPGGGPMAGIHAGMLLSQSQFVYVIGCDMPYPESAFIDLMKHKLEHASSAPSAGCMLRHDDGCLEPLNAFYHIGLVDWMEQALTEDNSSLQRFRQNSAFLWVTEEEGRAISPELKMFSNVNDYADLLDLRDGYEPAPRHDIQHTVRLPMARVSEMGTSFREDYVVREGHMSLLLNGEKIASFYALPERWEEFSIGWLYAQGIIENADDIESILIDAIEGTEDSFQANVALREKNGMSLEQRDVTPATPSNKIDNSLASYKNMERHVPLTFSLEIVGGLMELLDDKTSLFRETGGTHSMILAKFTGPAITDPVEKISSCGCSTPQGRDEVEIDNTRNRAERSVDYSMTDVCEDTSRHACLDKLIGRALLEKRDLTYEVLATSCRVTSTIIQKTVKAGIPVLMSRAAATSSAIRMAREAGLTLICFARGRRYNLMT